MSSVSRFFDGRLERSPVPRPCRYWRWRSDQSSYPTARDAQREEQAITLQIDAAANIRDFTNEGYGLRLTIVNESLRPVIVTGVQLLQAGKLVGEATGYLSDPGVLERSPIEPGAVTDERRELPITLGPREGKTFRLVQLEFIDARRIPKAKNAFKIMRREGRRFVSNVEGLPYERNKDKLEARITLAPDAQRQSLFEASRG